MKDNYNRDSYGRAQKRVREIKAFYMHLACYCVIIPVIIYVNLEFSPQYYWFVYSVIGWGSGLIIHGLAVFILNNSSWEEKKIKELMEKENGRKTKYE